ncbi:MAG: ATP-binding cassette domain-containing protein [Methyloligellaceae bacterium]
MTLPRIFGAGRRKLLFSLALNGVCQAAVVIGASLLLSHGLAEGASVSALPAVVMAGLLAAALSVIALRTFERGQAERLGQLYITACRSRLFKALSDLPLRGGPQVRYGVMMTRMITDLTSMKNWVSRGVAKLTVASFSIAGAITALTMLSPPLAAVTAVVVCFLLTVGALASLVFRARVRHVRRLRGRLAANVGELMPARGLSRHFGRLARERARLRQQSEAMSHALVRRSYVSGLMRSLSESVMPLTLSAAAFGAATFTTQGELSLATLAAGLFLIGLASGPLRDVLLALEYWATFSIGRQKLEATFSQIVEGSEPETCALGLREGPASLRLDSAFLPLFTAPLSAALRPGEVVLLTGPSGSGKSGLLGAISRLAQLDDEGKPSGITLDGCDMNATAAENWHRRVKLISNDLPLLKGSLSRNVRYGNPGLDDQQVRNVLAQCGVDADDDIFAAGLKSRLEEGGRNLPSGLRSRVALARAMAARPGLLLIDDANFLVDDACKTALKQIVAGEAVSVIVAAPGPSLVLEWDQVWRLHRGRLQTRSGDAGLSHASPGKLERV